jgi:serine/threonine protein kinase
MGCVYLGWDEQLRRKAAVKVLLPDLVCNAESRARFLREARAAAAVTHDHIVTIYEAGQDNQHAYLAMQYLQGLTLQQYLDKKGLPPLTSTVRIVREMASGLSAAHAVGLQHRDIKPGNIFLESPRGRVKILDFGLAAPFAPDDSKLTQTGMVVGTPAYMSPEQARCWKMDHRSDLFSLGVVLYQLCSGKLPFMGLTNMDVLTALVVDQPMPVGQLTRGLPFRLEVLIERLLDKNPEGRPQTAEEVVSDLRSIERELHGLGGPNVLVAEVEEEPCKTITPLPQSTITQQEEPEDQPRPRTRAVSRRVKRKHLAEQRRIFLTVLLCGMTLCVVVAVMVVVKIFTRTTSPTSTPTPAPNPTTRRPAVAVPEPDPRPPSTTEVATRDVASAGIPSASTAEVTTNPTAPSPRSPASHC